MGRLIPRPAGRAGHIKEGGYNLQAAIGLAGNDTRYNLIRVRNYKLTHCGR